MFNFFRPGYAPPGGALGALGFAAPELEIATEPSVIAYANYVEQIVIWGINPGDVVGNYAALLPMAANSAMLIDELNTVLAAGQLSSTTLAAIKTAVDSISIASPTGNICRVQIAIILVMCSPDYLVQK